MVITTETSKLGIFWTDMMNLHIHNLFLYLSVDWQFKLGLYEQNLLFFKPKIMNSIVLLLPLPAIDNSLYFLLQFSDVHPYILNIFFMFLFFFLTKFPSVPTFQLFEKVFFLLDQQESVLVGFILTHRDLGFQLCLLDLKTTDSVEGNNQEKSRKYRLCFWVVYRDHPPPRLETLPFVFFIHPIETHLCVQLWLQDLETVYYNVIIQQTSKKLNFRRFLISTAPRISDKIITFPPMWYRCGQQIPIKCAGTCESTFWCCSTL